MNENDVDKRGKRMNSARPGTVRRELEMRTGLVAVGDVLIDWFSERGQNAHQRAQEARAASARANTPVRVRQLAETIAKAEDINSKCAEAVQLIQHQLPYVSLSRMLAEMDLDESESGEQ